MTAHPRRHLAVQLVKRTVPPMFGTPPTGAAAVWTRRSEDTAPGRRSRCCLATSRRSRPQASLSFGNAMPCTGMVAWWGRKGEGVAWDDWEESGIHLDGSR